MSMAGTVDAAGGSGHRFRPFPPVHISFSATCWPCVWGPVILTFCVYVTSSVKIGTVVVTSIQYFCALKESIQ